MKIWILFLVASGLIKSGAMHNRVPGTTATSIEFQSKDKCELALNKIKRNKCGKGYSEKACLYISYIGCLKK